MAGVSESDSDEDHQVEEGGETEDCSTDWGSQRMSGEKGTDISDYLLIPVGPEHIH